MTLLEEVQEVMERTYRPAGIDLRECLIGRDRSRILRDRVGGDPEDVAMNACTFLRQERENLYVAIFFSEELIETLERDNPRETINHRNIGCLISFLEEITHAVHAALDFHGGCRTVESEVFACNLETQAKVDVYWLLLRFCRVLEGRAPTFETRAWLMDRLFGDERFDYRNRRLARRYRVAHRIARSFVERVEGIGERERVELIRNFREVSLAGKARLAGGVFPKGA